MAEQNENQSGDLDELSSVPLWPIKHNKVYIDLYSSLGDYDTEHLKKSLYIKMYKGKGLFNKDNFQQK